MKDELKPVVTQYACGPPKEPEERHPAFPASSCYLASDSDSYLRASERADRLHESGEKQIKCEDCKKWRWKFEQDQCERFFPDNSRKSAPESHDGC